MRIASILITALLGIQPLIAEEPTVESLSRRIEILEKQVATLTFQVTASSHQEPRVVAPDLVTRGEIIVNVLEDGRLRVEGKLMDDVEFAKRLKAVAAQFSNQPVRIRADTETKYQNVVRVIDLCQKSGIWNISFATAKPHDEQAAPSDGDKPAN